MKTCTKCSIEKHEFEFARKGLRKDGSQKFSSYCLSCQKIASTAHYRRNKAAYIKRARLNDAIYEKEARLIISTHLDDHPCIDCGETDPVVLDFDHVIGKKLFNISEFRKTGTDVERLVVEIAKCEIRCSNCHRRATHKRRQANKPLPMDSD